MRSKNSSEPDQIQREAQVWLRRLTSGNVTQLDLQGFRRWRAASASHAEAFVEARRVWDLLDPAMAAMLREQPELMAGPRSPVRPWQGRRAFLGAALGAAAVAGVAVVRPPLGLWPSIGEWQADYHTATGEQRRVALDDRTRIELNTQTSISRKSVDGQTVGLELIAGEAEIDLSAAGKPFNVTAGSGRSIAEVARFEVRYLEGQVCVTCLSGQVRIEHPQGTRTLLAHQQAIYDARTLGAVADVDPVDLSAWRDGVLAFRQAPLAHVVDEINRYRVGRVVLMASRVSNRAVSGRFAIAELDTVLRQIQYSYDLDARALPGNVLILS